MSNFSKVAVFPCGGIGLVLSSIARRSAYIINEDMLPEETEIADAARIISGLADELELIENYPSIIIDGCAHQCGSNIYRLLGLKPAARVQAHVIGKLPPSHVCADDRDKVKLAPGTDRRVLTETGKNLALEVSSRVRNIAYVLLKTAYQYEKQKLVEREVEICNYNIDIPEALEYVEVEPGIQRPKSMPPLPYLEKTVE